MRWSIDVGSFDGVREGPVSFLACRVRTNETFNLRISGDATTSMPFRLAYIPEQLMWYCMLLNRTYTWIY